VRSASLRAGGRIVYVARIRLRRVRCRQCQRSWALWPPGLWLAATTRCAW
jgi:hypothetical protein